MTKDRKDLIAAICVEWDTTEEIIKQAEQICQDIVFPSINELRYAGRRIVDALNMDGDPTKEDQVKAYLKDAEFNCLRARHDAIDASLSKIAIDVSLMIDKLKHDVILMVYPEFAKFVELMEKSRELIRKSRKNREDRDSIYISVSKTEFPVIVSHYRSIQSSEGMMISIAKNNRIEKLFNRVVAVSGTVFGIAGLALAYYFWKYPVAP